MCKDIKKPDRVQSHTQNVYYLLPLDCNNGNANAPQYYVIRILPVLLSSVTSTPLNLVPGAGKLAKIWSAWRQHEIQHTERRKEKYNYMNWVRGWLRHCATSLKVAGSIPDGITGIFHWHNPSCRTMALGLTQPLTEMSTRDISWEVRRTVRRADDITTFTCRLSWNLGASIFWNPQGLSRPVMGMLSLLQLHEQFYLCGYNPHKSSIAAY